MVRNQFHLGFMLKTKAAQTTRRARDPTAVLQASLALKGLYATFALKG